MGREEESREVSRILAAAEGGEPVDMGRLLPLVYGQLRAIAARHMAKERESHTLSATALVHEAYIRLVGREPPAYETKGRFFTAAAESMRRILIDHARKRKSKKRGGARRCLPLDAVTLAARDDPAEILSLDEALLRLEEMDRRAAEVVKLRFFAGLSETEAADALGLTYRTVRRDWRFARAWLERELAEG
jgi:RNA polymerase sigma factor (TIGR02999 family)